MEAVRIAAHFFRTAEEVSRHGTDGTTTWDGKTSMGYTRLASPVSIGCSTTGSPIRTGSQDIISPRGYIGLKWIRDVQPLDTFINGIYSEHRDTAPTWSKEIFEDSPTNPEPTSTRSVGWTSCLTLSSLKVQNSWIWCFFPSTHQMNSGPSLYPLLELERWLQLAPARP